MVSSRRGSLRDSLSKESLASRGSRRASLKLPHGIESLNTHWTADWKVDRDAPVHSRLTESQLRRAKGSFFEMDRDGMGTSHTMS